MTARNTKALVLLALIVLLSIHAGTAHAQEATTVEISQNAEFGDILTDAGGNTVYLFTEDERNKSNCAGGCATAWPPLLTVGDPTAGEGVNADRLGTITRDDGSTQVAYNGWPLYYFPLTRSLGTPRDNMVLGSSSRPLAGRSRITLQSTPPRTRSLGRCWWKPAVAACTSSPTTSAISPTAPEAAPRPGPLC